MKRTLKKSLAIILAAATILCCAPLSGLVGINLSGIPNLNFNKSEAVEASEGTLEDGEYVSGTDGRLKWSLNKAFGTLTIVGTGKMSNYSWKDMADWRNFGYAEEIENVVILDGVQSIGTWAFYGCEKLEFIKIPKSVTVINEEAFEKCTSLADIYYCGTEEEWNNIEINENNEYLSKAIIHYNCLPEEGGSGVCGADGDNITWTFNENGQLILEGVGKMETNPAPWYVYSDLITDVQIRDGITNIDNSAFSGYNIASVTIPDSVTNIGDNAFWVCFNLKDVYYTGSEEEWNAITIGSNNEFLTNAKIHYNYTLPDLGDDEEIPEGVYYTATWNCDGEVISSETILVGSVIIAPSVPGKLGYVFAGWDGYTEGMVMPSHDITFTAIWLESVIPPSEDDPDEPNECETVVGILEEYVITVIFDEDISWISKVCIDGQWFNLYEDYAYQEKIESYEDKQVVAVIYNGYVSTIELLSELETDPEIYNFASVPTLEYCDGVFRKYNGSRADKWYIANGKITNHLVNTLIDASKIPASESLKFKNVAVTIESSDKDIISLDNGFWDIESDSMTIELGDIEAGASVSFSEEVLNLKTGWDFPDDEKEHSVTLYYTVTGTLNGETITRETSEPIKLINKDHSSGSSSTSTSYKKQSVRELFEEMKKGVNSCDELNGIQKFSVSLIISSHLIAMDLAGMKDALDATEKIYEIGCYISGINSVTYMTAGEYVIDAIYEQAYQGDEELQEALDGLLGDLRKSKEFNTFIQWYCDQQGTYKNSNKKTDVNCPVDVYVYDKKGRQVLSIVENVITDADEGIHAFVCDDEKTIYLPTDTDYDIKIIATDNGTLDYFITEYNSENELRKTCYEDIPLVTDRYYTGKIASTITPDADEYNLHDSDGIEITYDKSDVIDTVHIPGEWEITKETTCAESGEAVLICTICGEILEIAGIPAGGHNVGTWITVIEPTTETEGKKIKKCTVCSETIEEESIEKLPEITVNFEIRNPSTTTISYGDSIILHADIDGELPEGYTVEWTASNGNFSWTADGETCKISPKSSGNTTFIATIYDAEDNPVSSDEQIMTSKAGFFDKIIAFFKGLFGLTKTYSDIFKA